MKITHDDVVRVLRHAISNHLIWATAHGDKAKDIAVVRKILDAISSGQFAVGPDPDFPAEVDRIRGIVAQRESPDVDALLIADALVEVGTALRLPPRLRLGLAHAAAHILHQADALESMTHEYLLHEAIEESKHHPRN